MNNPEESRLRERILDEIFFALGASRAGILRRLFGWLMARPAGNFARIIARFQGLVPEIGFGPTAIKVLPELSTTVHQHILGEVPTSGPLIVASNHIGAHDSFVVTSVIPRKDLKMMVSDVGFLRTMSIADDFFIFVPWGESEAVGRMAALQQAIDHLKSGGALLVYAHGEVEPDPDLIPGAGESLDEWSPSLEIMLRKVPAARLQIALMSGIIQRKFLQNPLIRIRREPFTQQKLAELFQLIQLFVWPSSLNIHTKISLSAPKTLSDFGDGRAMPGIIRDAKILLAEHVEHFGK